MQRTRPARGVRAPLPLPLFCKAIDALGGRRSPWLAAFLLFGMPWNAVMVAFLVLRWPLVSWPAAFSYVAGAVLWNLAPAFLYLHHVRHFPRFVADAQEMSAHPQGFLKRLTSHAWLPRRLLRLALASLLFPVAVATYWGLTPFLFSRGGFTGYTDPFFWAIFTAWMGWFAFLALPGLVAIATSLRAVHDLADSGLRLRPLHPDGAGGLAAAGRFVIRSSWGVSMGCMFLPMVLVALPEASAPLALVVALVVIGGLLVAAAATPLSRVQRAASKAKRQGLERLEDDYRRLTSLLGPTGQDRRGLAKPANGALAALAQLRLQESALLAAAPTFPVSFGAVASFAFQVVLPMILAAAQVVVGIAS